MRTSSPKHIPTIPELSLADQAGWLIGAASDAPKKTEAEDKSAENLISVLQAYALLGVAVEKLQAAAVEETPARSMRTGAS